MTETRTIAGWELSHDGRVARATTVVNHGVGPVAITVELDDDELGVETDSLVRGSYVPLVVLAQLWQWRHPEPPLPPTDERLSNLLGRWGCKPVDMAGCINDLRAMFGGVL